MRLVTLVFMIAATQLAVAAADDAKSGKKDAEARKKLVGIWKGRVIKGATGHNLTFTTDLIKGKRGEKQDLGEGSFKLDLTSKPARLDASPTKGPEKGETYLGIYLLKGDTLKWCVSTPGNERPTEFATRGTQFFLVLKREKKPEKK